MTILSVKPNILRIPGPVILGRSLITANDLEISTLTYCAKIVWLLQIVCSFFALTTPALFQCDFQRELATRINCEVGSYGTALAGLWAFNSCPLASCTVVCFLLDTKWDMWTPNGTCMHHGRLLRILTTRIKINWLWNGDCN